MEPSLGLRQPAWRSPDAGLRSPLRATAVAIPPARPPTGRPALWGGQRHPVTIRLIRAKSPTSPIAVAHEMARKNGRTAGAFNPIFVGLALLAAFAMMAVDARGRPVLASVAYSLTVFVMVSTTLARMPAFAQSLPSVPETALAAAVTVQAGVAGGRARARGSGAARARSRKGLEGS
jgi:hypothetical protein